MRYLLDTNILSDLIRNPNGRVTERIRQVGEEQVVTSIIVAAELRYGAAKKASQRLTDRVEDMLSVIKIVPLDEPTDTVYAVLRTQLERKGLPIGANDLLIAAQVISLRLTLVTDNEREFARVEGLVWENWLNS